MSGAEPQNQQTSTLDGRGAASATSLLPPRLTRGAELGRFTVLEHLGTGGMGQVYAAYDPRLDRRIALKILRPISGSGKHERRARLLREARALAQLNDPHVLTIFDVGTFDDQVFLAMEYVPGVDLGRWLAAEKRSRGQVLEVFRQAGLGLEAAHRAGVTHRDFKLGNVMVRPDGRAVVVDFGLARRDGPAFDEAEEDSDEGTSPTSQDLQLTAAGARMGTPLFMAPEQWSGGEVGPLADQFAFCVALYFGLYGELPFEKPGGRGQAPRWTVRQAPESEEGAAAPGARSARSVPFRWRRALLRGLEPRPEDRWPSMRHLLDELATDPFRTRRWRFKAAALLVLAIAGLLLWGSVARPAPCSAGQSRLGAVWSAERRVQLESALAATGRPYSPAVARSTGARLDGYAQAWLSMYLDACEATHVRGEQSSELLDRRMACLDQRRRQIDALVGLMLEEPDRSVEEAVSAVEALPSLSACADTAALLAVIPPPPGSERRRVESVRSGLAEAETLLLAGRYDRAEEVMADLLSAAEASGYLPLLAEALVTEGTLHSHLGEATEAARIFERALRVAQAAGHDRPAAEAFVRLVRVAGFEQGDLERGEELGGLATAMLRGLDRGEDLQAILFDQLGVLALERGAHARAADFHQQALQLRRDRGETGGPAEANTLRRLGNVHLAQGHLREAEARYREALALQEQVLGFEHPAVAATLDRLGAVAHQGGHLDDARRFFERAAAIQQRVFGPENLSLASSLANLANVLSSQGETDEALALYDQVLAIYVREHGAEHPWAGITWINISAVRNQQNDFGGAAEAAGSALAILETSYGSDHPLVAQALSSRGEALNEMERFAEAERLHRRALEIQTQTYDGENPIIGHTLISLGRSVLGQGRRHEATRLFERALELWQDPGTDPAHVAWGRWMLAGALAPGDPKRAEDLARRAREAFDGAAGDHSETVVEIDAFLGVLASH